jgi:hypothetical protein
MNGGHYLTKGHIILCLLYSKTSLMSRNILEPGKSRFLSCKQPLAESRFAPSTLDILDGSSAADKLPRRKQRGIGCHSVLDMQPAPHPGSSPGQALIRGNPISFPEFPLSRE